jgi:hypothetical protein
VPENSARAVSCDHTEERWKARNTAGWVVLEVIVQIEASPLCRTGGARGGGRAARACERQRPSPVFTGNSMGYWVAVATGDRLERRRATASPAPGDRRSCDLQRPVAAMHQQSASNPQVPDLEPESVFSITGAIARARRTAECSECQWHHLLHVWRGLWSMAD